MTEQRTFTDYTNLGDTGEDTTQSIQPVDNAEPAVAPVFNRPSENLRSRTEIIREGLESAQYYRDRAQSYAIQIASGGNISWAGTVLGGGTGLVTNTAQITLKPFLNSAANTKGSLDVGVAATNQVQYQVANLAYATEGLNSVFVEHRDILGTPNITVDISSGPIKSILVVFDSTNVLHTSAAAVAALAGAIAGDAVLTGKLNVVDNGVPGNAIAAISPTLIEGTADVEEHVISSGAITALTTTTPLEEGDAIAIWYKYLIEPPGGDPSDPKGGDPGGREESNPARGNTNVDGNLFITSEEPSKIPGAIVLGRVIDDQFVLSNHQKIAKNSNSDTLVVQALIVNGIDVTTHINSTSNPHQVTVQQAFDASGVNPVLEQGANTFGIDHSGGSPVLYLDNGDVVIRSATPFAGTPLSVRPGAPGSAVTIGEGGQLRLNNIGNTQGVSISFLGTENQAWALPVDSHTTQIPNGDTRGLLSADTGGSFTWTSFLRDFMDDWNVPFPIYNGGNAPAVTVSAGYDIEVDTGTPPHDATGDVINTGTSRTRFNWFRLGNVIVAAFSLRIQITNDGVALPPVIVTVETPDSSTFPNNTRIWGIGKVGSSTNTMNAISDSVVVGGSGGNLQLTFTRSGVPANGQLTDIDALAIYQIGTT